MVAKELIFRPQALFGPPTEASSQRLRDTLSGRTDKARALGQAKSQHVVIRLKMGRPKGRRWRLASWRYFS